MLECTLAEIDGSMRDGGLRFLLNRPGPLCLAMLYTSIMSELSHYTSNVLVEIFMLNLPLEC